MLYLDFVIWEKEERIGKIKLEHIEELKKLFYLANFHAIELLHQSLSRIIPFESGYLRLPMVH